MFKKIITYLTVISFVYSSAGAPCVQAALDLSVSEQTTSQLKKAVSSPLPAVNLDIPISLGRVTGGNDRGGNMLVVNIQDLHCHSEVQRNINGILGFLDKKYGLKKVFVEGGYGRIDTSWLNTVTDRAVKKQALDALLENGRLTGSEYFSMAGGRYDILQGLEDEELHKANIVRLGKILDKKQQYEQKLKALNRGLDLMKVKYLRPENKRFNRILAKHRSGAMSDARFYALLNTYVEKINEHPEQYHNILPVNENAFPAIQAYRETLELQKHLRYKRIGVQMQAFLQVLKTRLPYAAYNTLLQKTDNLARGDVLYPALARIAEEYQLDIRGRFPDLAGYFSYIEKNRSLNPIELLNETQRLTEQLRAAFSRDAAERDVSFLADFFGCFEDYLLNRLSAEDYAFFQSRFERFIATWGKYTYKNHILDLAADFPLLDDYYAANVRRNTVFLKNMLTAAPATSSRNRIEGAPEVVVMISGGFHTAGMARLLDERKISYCTITPNVTGDPAPARNFFESTVRYQAKLFGVQALSATPLVELDPRVTVNNNGDIAVTIRGGAQFRVFHDRTFVVDGDVSVAVDPAETTGITVPMIKRNMIMMIAMITTRQTPLAIAPALLYEAVNVLGASLAHSGITGDGLHWDIASNTAVQDALAQYMPKDNALEELSAWLAPLQEIVAGQAVTSAALNDVRQKTESSVLKAVLSVPGVIETLAGIYGSPGREKFAADDAGQRNRETFVGGALAEQYGIAVTEMHSLSGGTKASIKPVLVRTDDGRRYVFRTLDGYQNYNAREMTDYIVTLQRRLGAHGIPVPGIMKKKGASGDTNDDYITQIDGRYYILENFRDGMEVGRRDTYTLYRTLKKGVAPPGDLPLADTRHWASLGTMAARVHNAFDGLPMPQDDSNYVSLEKAAKDFHGAMDAAKGEISKSSPGGTRERFVRKMYAKFMEHYALFAQQFTPKLQSGLVRAHIHGDLQFCNVKFDADANITAVLDLGKARQSLRIYEFTNALMGFDAFPEYPDFVAMITAYQSAVQDKLSESEIRAVGAIVRFRLLSDITSHYSNQELVIDPQIDQAIAERIAACEAFLAEFERNLDTLIPRLTDQSEGTGDSGAGAKLSDAVRWLFRLPAAEGSNAGNDVTYCAVINTEDDQNTEPRLYEGAPRPQSAERIFMLAPTRMNRPGVLRQSPEEYIPGEIEASPSVQKLNPSRLRGERLVRWKSARGTAWNIMRNQHPLAGGDVNHMLLIRADTNKDGSDAPVPQTEMSSLDAITDVLDFQYALNESLPADEPRYAAGVNGWFYSRQKGAVRGGASQNRAHAQILRLSYPIEHAKTKMIGITADDIEVSVLAEEGWGSAIVLEADTANRAALASMMRRTIQNITDKGHSFNFLAKPADGRLRVFIFDRTATRPAGLDDEAGVSQLAGVVPVSDPAKFFQLDQEEPVDVDNPAAWVRNRIAAGKTRLNAAYFLKARSSLASVTASREEVEQLAWTLLDGERDTGAALEEIREALSQYEQSGNTRKDRDISYVPVVSRLLGLLRERFSGESLTGAIDASVAVLRAVAHVPGLIERLEGIGVFQLSPDDVFAAIDSCIAVINDDGAFLADKLNAIRGVLAIYSEIKRRKGSGYLVDDVRERIGTDPRLALLAEYSPQEYGSVFIDLMKVVAQMPNLEFAQFKRAVAVLRNTYQKTQEHQSEVARSFMAEQFDKRELPMLLIMESILPGSIMHVADLLRSTITRGEPDPMLVSRFLDGKRAALSDRRMTAVLALSLQHIRGNRTGRKKIVINPADFFKIINMADCFVKNGATQDMKDVVGAFEEKDASVAALIDKLYYRLSERLVQSMAKDAGVVVGPTAFKSLYLPFLPRLFTAKQCIAESYTEQLPWFEGVVKATLEGRFWDFIENVSQDDATGKSIAVQNERMRALMGRAGIQADRYIGRRDENRFQPKVFSYNDKQYSLRPMRRDPGHDLFIGDFTDCCLAMSSDEAPQAMVQRLIDETMNVIEVLNEKGMTMACLWLYLADDGSLVIQNIEIAAEYERDQLFKDMVAREMIEYARGFSRYINAPRLLIGKAGHGKYFEEGEYVNRIFARNKAQKEIPFQMGKLGGYFANPGGQQVKYYLVTANKPTAYLVADNEQYHMPGPGQQSLRNRAPMVFRFITDDDVVEPILSSDRAAMGERAFVPSLWLTTATGLRNIPGAAGVTPAPLGISVAMQENSAVKHPMYYVINAGNVFLGFAEDAPEMDPVHVTAELSRNAALWEQVIQRAAARAGMAISSLPDMTSVPPVVIVPGRAEKARIAGGVIVVSEAALPKDPLKVRAMIQALQDQPRENVMVGPSVALDASGLGADINSAELLKQTGTASLILTREHIETLAAHKGSPGLLAVSQANGKFLYVDAASFNGDRDALAAFVKEHGLNGHYESDAAGMARLYGPGGHRACVTVAVEDLARSQNDRQTVKIISLKDTLSRGDRALSMDELMGTLHQFDAPFAAEALKQSIEKAIQIESVGAILRAA